MKKWYVLCVLLGVVLGLAGSCAIRAATVVGDSLILKYSPPLFQTAVVDAETAKIFEYSPAYCNISVDCGSALDSSRPHGFVRHRYEFSLQLVPEEDAEKVVLAMREMMCALLMRSGFQFTRYRIEDMTKLVKCSPEALELPQEQMQVKRNRYLFAEEAVRNNMKANISICLNTFRQNEQEQVGAFTVDVVFYLAR